MPKDRLDLVNSGNAAPEASAQQVTSGSGTLFLLVLLLGTRERVITLIR
jgi:hypothetical protein